jgi:hypothetical protein
MPAWAGGWDNVYGAPYALLNEPGAIARGVARLMASQAAKSLAGPAAALTGQAVGSVIPPGSVSYAQVSARQADAANMGGLVLITTRAEITGNTTTTQEIMIDQQLLPRFMPAMAVAGVETSGYPVDKSGNGGGGILNTVNRS